jgi:hypothetical protein
MARTTLADIRASRIPESLNIAPTDPRFVAYVNEASRRLLHMGKWHGTTGRFRMSVTAQLVTLPPQIAVIEAVALDSKVYQLRDQWFEFLDHGWGPRDDTSTTGSGTPDFIHRGYSCTISDVIGVDKKLRWICDLASDVGKQLIVMGYDETGNWIRTSQGGSMRDGEAVTLAQTPGALTTHNFSAVTDIILPSDMDGQCWLYEEQDGTATQRLIGNYQYFETRPNYPRYLLPAVNATASTVELIGKLAFVPVAHDNDYNIIGNPDALKLACMAVIAEEQHNWVEANLLWYGGKMADATPRIGAVQLLEQELDHHTGSGRRIGMTVAGSSASDEPITTIW